jgi:aminoglycoside phosphotransferase (APT) family kinase protein
MLEQSDVAHYLLSLGVVKPRSVLDDDFVVVDASRRNRVFLATTRSGPAFVVKQATAGNASTLAHEAAILRVLAGAQVLAPHVPAVVHEETGLLVLSTEAGGRDWADHQGRFPRIPARILGRVLAGLHALPADAPRGAGPIWGLELGEPPRALVLELSAGAQDLLARIQASDYVCGRLEELRDARSGDALVHGDLRWENCLALPAPGARRRTRVLLVDWELADRADPAFDVGSVLAEYLRVWVGSVPIVEAVDPGRLVARARHPLAAMRPAVGAFWASYCGVHTQPPALRRVMELTAVRLLQTAIERAQGLSAPSAHVVTLVQLADNLLRRPEDAALGLLGLRA